MAWHMAAIWDVVAQTVPDSLAVVQGDIRRTWRVYEERASRLAGAFVSAGVTPGSKIAIYGFNSIGWLEAHYAAMKARAAAANVNYRYTAHELAFLVDNSNAEVLVFDAQLGDRVEAILPRLGKLRLLIEIDDGSGRRLAGAETLEGAVARSAPLPRQDYSDDDLCMLYTGGTTGLPKGVLYRQGVFAKLLAVRAANVIGEKLPESVEGMADLVRKAHASGAAPVSAPACPLMHGTGLAVGVITPHNLGGAAVIFRNEHFDAAQLFRLIERERVTDVAIVGDAFAKPMIEAYEQAEHAGAPYDISSLRHVHSAGVMFSHRSKLEFLRFADVVITDMISASETIMGVSVTSRRTPQGETGAFMMHPSTKVFNDRDEEVAPGSDEIGRVANCAVVPVGYHGDAEKSAATFRTVRGTLYCFPGDFAKVASDGRLILLGRGSNCINTGGEKVFPEEVEETLKQHPHVADCLVLGAPDERFGQRVVAVVQAREGFDAAAVSAFARTHLAGYKIPRQFICAPQIARGPNGKPDYAWALALATSGGSASVGPRPGGGA
jgi:acyl-CoA synthetase (AMP-forming)/AMP-acid ligase II